MASQTGSIDLTASNSVKLAAEAGWQSDLDSYYTKSEIDVTVGGINSTVSTKVGEDEVISSINQSSESVSINANKINLTGAVTISDLASDASTALTDAAKTATNYIRADSTGVRIANANPSTATTYQHLTATNTEFVAGGNTVATFGSTVTLGGAGGSHMVQTGTSTTFYGSDGELEVAKLETDSSGDSAFASLTMAENVAISAGSAGSMSIVSVGADSDNGDMSLSASYGHRSSGLRLGVSDTFEPEDEYGNATFTFYDDSGEVIKRVILNGDGSIRSDGQIISYRTVTGKYQVIAENDTSGRSIALESSNAGNIGLYDIDSMRWILWKDSTDLLTIYGLADNFAVTTTAVTSTTAIAGGGYLSGSASVSKTGWTPIGVVGWNSSTRYAVTVRAFLYESYVDDGTVNWMVYNAGTSSITPTVSVYVLWARS